MSYKYAGVLLGVLINEEEEDKLLHGSKGTDGLLHKYAQSLHQEEQYERFGVPAYAQHAGPDYLGFFLFTGGEKMVEHYVAAGLAHADEFKVMELPPFNMADLHLTGLLANATEQWMSFTDFCRKCGVSFPLPKLLLVIDRE